MDKTVQQFVEEKMGKVIGDGPGKYYRDMDDFITTLTNLCDHFRVTVPNLNRETNKGKPNLNKEQLKILSVMLGLDHFAHKNFKLLIMHESIQNNGKMNVHDANSGELGINEIKNHMSRKGMGPYSGAVTGDPVPINNATSLMGGRKTKNAVTPNVWDKLKNESGRTRGFGKGS